MKRRKKRRKIYGIKSKPRLVVSRSLNNIYGQVINDLEGKTLLAVSSLKLGCYGGNIAAAKEVGKLLAEKAKTAGIKKLVFDRAGLAYHGRVKALADAVREGGIQF